MKRFHSKHRTSLERRMDWQSVRTTPASARDASQTDHQSILLFCVKVSALFALFFCLSSNLQAQETREIWIPSNHLETILKKKPRAVFLTPEQYRTLATDSHRAVLAAEKEKLTPPVTAAIRSVSMTGRIQPGTDVVAITAIYEIECLTDEWTEIPLVLPLSHLGHIEVDNESALRITKASNPILLTRSKGIHEVKAGFHIPVAGTPGGESIKIHSPGVATAKLTLQLPEGTKLKSLLPFHINEGQADFTIPSQPDGCWDIEWTAREVAAIPGAAVFQTCSYLYTIDSTRLQADLGLILNSSLTKLNNVFIISLPEGVRILSVEGSELKRWDRNSDGEIEVKLLPGRRDTTDLRLRVEQDVPHPGDTNEMTLSLPVASIKSVHRASGTMTILGADDIRIKQISTGPLTVPIPDDIEGPSTNLPNYIASFQFPVQKEAPTVSLSKVEDRFNTQLDTAITLKREALYIERTALYLPLEGNLFEASINLPANEEIVSITCPERKDFSWKEAGSTLILLWDSGLSNTAPATITLATRRDPENWYQLSTTPVDLHFESIEVIGAESLSGYVAVKFDSSFHVATDNTEGLAPRDGRNTPVKGNLAWFRLDDFSLDLKPGRKPSELEASFTAYALPLANTLEIEGQLALEIRHSGIRELSIDTPPQISQYLRFDSPIIAQQERDKSTGTWTLTFHEEQSGNARIRYNMNLPLEVTETEEIKGEKKFEFTLPQLSIKSARRTRGDWIMEANTDTELSFTTEGLDSVDSLHVPKVSGYKPRHRIIAAFEYRGDDWNLSLSGTRHPHSDIITTVVDQLDIDTVVSTDGTDRHQATIAVRSAGDQFLEIKMPKHSVLWSLAIDGERTKPVRSGRDRLRVLLPAHEDTRKSIVISVIYQTPGKSWDGSGREKLIPVTLSDSVPVMSSNWRLHLPEGFDYQRFKTNLRKGFKSNDRILLGHVATTWMDWRRVNRSTEPSLVLRKNEKAEAGLDGISDDGPQPGGPQAAENYVIRMQERVKRADEAALRGSQFMADGDFEGAVEQYRNAGDLLPDAPMTAQRRRAYVKQYSRAATTLARAYADGGRYNGAVDLIEDVLRPTVSPDNLAARRLLEQLNDPEYYSPALTPQHLERIRKVKMAMKTGQGYLDYGDYDQAEREYQKALNIDRYNSAARSSLEDVERHRLNYYDVARDQTRSTFMRKIAEEWELPVPTGVDIPDLALGGGSATQDIIRNESKLKSIRIPSLEFSDTPLKDALQFIQQKSVELDFSEPDLNRKGINIVLSGMTSEAGVGNTPITLRLTNVPIGEALRYTANLAQLKYKVESHAVVIVPLSTPDADLFTNQYRVPPTFLRGGSGGGAGTVADPFVPEPASPNAPASVRLTAKQILENAGITFSPGSTAIYNPSTSTLIVKNSPDQMDLVEAYIESIKTGPTEGPRSSSSIFRLPDETSELEERDSAVSEIEEKLTTIRIPGLEFSETPLKDAIAFIQQKMVEMDLNETDSSRKGVNLILPEESGRGGGFGFEGGGDKSVGNTPITLRLTNVPAGEALRYVTNLAQLKYKIEPHGVVVVPLSTPDNVELTSAQYIVAPDMYQKLTDPGNFSGGDAFAADPLRSQPLTPKEAMENAGITFPPGSNVEFDESKGVLKITNSRDQADLVEAYLSSLDDGRPIVQITSKYLERTPDLSSLSYMENDPIDGTMLNSIEDLPKVEDLFKSGDITIKENRLNLKSTVIEGVDFRDKTVEEAVDMLEAKMRSVPDGAHAAAPLEINLALEKADEGPAKKKLDFAMARATALEVLDKIVGESDTRYFVTKSGVVIADRNTQILPMETVFIPMPGRVFQSVNDDGSIHDHHARNVLKAAGIDFPRGSSAAYNPSSRRLAVRNTKENLEAVINQYAAEMKAAVENPDAPENDLRFSSEFLGGAMDLKGFNVRDIGRLPIEFDLPQSGRMYQFLGLYAPDGIGFRYVNWERQIRVAWGWILVGCLGFLFGAWRYAKMPLFLGVFAVIFLSFLPMVFSEGMAPFCNSLLIGWLLGMAAWLVYLVVKKLTPESDWRFFLIPLAFLLFSPGADAGEHMNVGWAASPSMLLRVPTADGLAVHPTVAILAGLLALLFAWKIAGRKLRFFFLLVLVFSLYSFAKAVPPEQPPVKNHTVYVPYDPEKPVSEQKATRYYLDYETFHSLWKQVKTHRQSSDRIKDAKSGYTLTTSLYRMASAPKLLSVSGRLSVTTTGKDWQRVPLNFRGANLSKIKLDGKVASFQNGAILIEKAGSHLVEVSFELPFQDGQDATEWSIPKSSGVLLEISMDSDLAEPVLQKGWPLAKSKTDNNRTLFTAAIGQQEKITFRRLLKTSGRSMTRPNSAIIDARLFVAQGLEQLEASYLLNFDGQEDNRFSIAFENTYTPVSFDIPNLSLWEIKDKPGTNLRELTFFMTQPAQNFLTVKFTGERLIDTPGRKFPQLSAEAGRIEQKRHLLRAAGLAIKPAPGANHRQIGSAPDTSGFFPVSTWSLTGQNEDLNYVVTEKRAKRQAEASYVYQLGAGKLETIAQFQIRSPGEPLLSINTKVPANAKIQRIEGNRIKDWWRTGDELFIRFSGGTPEVTAVLIYLSRQVEDADDQFSLPVSSLALAGFAGDEVTGEALVVAHTTRDISITFGESGNFVQEIGSDEVAKEFEILPPMARKRGFRFEKMNFSGEIASAKLSPRFNSLWVMLAQVHESWIRLSVHTDVEVTRSGLDRVSFQTSTEVPEFRIPDDDVREVRTTEENGIRTYEVIFQQFVTDGISFTIETELPHSGTAALPDITILNGDRQERFLIVENLSSERMDLEPKNLDPTVMSLLPYKPTTLVSAKLYRAIRPDWSLDVALENLETSSGNDAVILYAESTSAFRASGEEWLKAEYHIQNRSLQFLPVAIPGGAELVSVVVANAEVRADKGKIDGKDVILVPLIQTKPGQLAYDVKLVFRSRGKTNSIGKRLKRSLNDPDVFGPTIEKTIWKVHLPAGHELAGFDGNMQPIDEQESNLRKLQSDMAELKSLNWLSTQTGSGATVQIDSNYNADVLAKRIESKLDGFQTYGKPIEVEAITNDLKAQKVMITENRIAMPVFNQNQGDTSVNAGGNIAIDATKSKDVSWADNSGEIKRRNLNYYDVARDQTRRLESQLRVNDNISVGNKFFNNLKTKPQEEAKSASVSERYKQIGHMSQNPRASAVQEKMIRLNRVQNVEQSEVINKKGKVAKPAAVQKEQSGRINYSNARSAFSQIGHGGMANVTVDTAPDPFGGGGAAAVPFGGGAPAQTVQGTAVDRTGYSQVQTESEETFGNALKAAGRNSISVDFPVEGRAFFFQKLKDHAELKIVSKERRDSGKPGAIFGMLALLGLVVLVKVFFETQKKRLFQKL